MQALKETALPTMVYSKKQPLKPLNITSSHIETEGNFVTTVINRFCVFLAKARTKATNWCVTKNPSAGFALYLDLLEPAESAPGAQLLESGDTHKCKAFDYEVKQEMTTRPTNSRQPK